MNTPLADAVRAVLAAQNDAPDLQPLWLRFQNYLYSSIRQDARQEPRLVRHAYRTVCRTLRGVSRVSGGNAAKIATTAYLTGQLDILETEAPTTDDFDRWHQETCAGVQNIWKDCFPVSVGQAQKWINILLKYHAAFGANGLRPAIRGRFLSYMHVPIDSQIYDFLAAIAPEIKGAKPDWFYRNRPTLWSAIRSYDTEYMSLQRLFRELATTNGIPPIGLDLVAWRPA